MSTAESRIFRVFVSSTFRDMQRERDALVKRVFPPLRKLCEERGVAWGEVDLRWGITDEDAAEGKILPICLAEIDNCRPYFIGILGERYGYILPEVTDDLMERQPWIAQYRQHSVTELEILHGVLRNPEMAERAFFYFRHPDFLLPESEDRAAYLAESVSARNKTQALKARIRESGLPVREGYRTLEEFEELVRRDLMAVLDGIYPENAVPDETERENLAHESFAASRTAFYTGGKGYMERLNEHLRSPGPPLVVTGEAGMGKSALLAAWWYQVSRVPLTASPRSSWLQRLRRVFSKSRPVEPTVREVLVRFVGVTNESLSWEGLVRRILAELQERFHFREDIPPKRGPLRAAFRQCLHTAAERGLRILILDGLDALDRNESEIDLRWLPTEFPQQLHVILSTRPGRTLLALEQRQWPIIEIQTLSADERKRFIRDYLAYFRKTLTADRIERLALAAGTGNPVFLRTVLEELRVFGIHEQLDEQLNYYLTVAAPEELFDRVLARYERDYDRDRPGTVGDAFSLLCASRFGLTEPELLDLLGRADQPLPLAYWSPIYLAARDLFANRCGVLMLDNAHLRQAVRARYLSTSEQDARIRRRIADYCQGKAFEILRSHPERIGPVSSTPRAIRNLSLSKAWTLLSEAEPIQRSLDRVGGASDLLLVIPGALFVVTAYFAHRSCADYFRELIELAAQSPKRLLFWLHVAKQEARFNARLAHTLAQMDAMMPSDHEQAPSDAQVEVMAGMLKIQSQFAEAFAFEDDADEGEELPSLGATGNIYAEALATSESDWQKRMDSARKKGSAELIQVLKWRGIAYRGKGEYSRSIEVFDQLIDIARQIGDNETVFDSYYEKSIAASMAGDETRALESLREQEQFARQLNDDRLISQSLQQQDELKERIKIRSH